MESLIFGGVYSPIITPFKENGEVDFTAFDANLAKWNDLGLAGYVVFGPNGEAAYLTEQEKLALVKACVGTAPKGKQVIVGSGLESTKATIELTNKCASLGADAALIITPSFYKGNMTKEALKKHFVTVADNSDLPIFLYNAPEYSGINLNGEFIVELSGHQNIIGINDSSGNIAQLAEILSLVGNNFNVLEGSANLFLPGLILGAKGGIQTLATYFPKECVALYELFKAGKYEEAKNLQLRLLPVNNTIGEFGIPGLKAAMEIMGFAGGLPRYPLLPLSKGEKTELKSVLEKGQMI